MPKYGFQALTKYREIFMFGIIGVATNILGYCTYLFLTYWGLTPRITITILYPMFFLISFFVHRRFSFRSQSEVHIAGPKYIFTQVVGFLVNWILLFVFVDLGNFDHRIIQALAILIVGFLLFFLNKRYVFNS